MGDKIKARAEALQKKAGDPDRDLRTEYEKEKLKEYAHCYTNGRFIPRLVSVKGFCC
jgi:hypothetical protein